MRLEPYWARWQAVMMTLATSECLGHPSQMTREVPRLRSAISLLHWMSVCTNQVVDGSIDFLNPDALSDNSRFYRAIPQNSPPSE
jgi:hypothetical protein